MGFRKWLQAIGSRLSGHSPRPAFLFWCAMVEQLTKVASCVAYTRRSLHKAGLHQIASKLTPVLADVKAEIVSLTSRPVMFLEVGIQTDVSLTSTEDMTSSDEQAKQSAHSVTRVVHGCSEDIDVGCQTENGGDYKSSVRIFDERCSAEVPGCAGESGEYCQIT